MTTNITLRDAIVHHTLNDCRIMVHNHFNTRLLSKRPHTFLSYSHILDLCYLRNATSYDLLRQWNIGYSKLKELATWLPLMTCRRQPTFLSIQSYPSYPHWTLKSLENRMNLLCLSSFVLLLGRFHHGPSFIAWKGSSFSQSTMHFVSLQLEGLVAVFVCYDQQFFLLSTREIATGFIFIYLLPCMIHQYEGLEKNSCSNCSFLLAYEERSNPYCFDHCGCGDASCLCFCRHFPRHPHCLCPSLLYGRYGIC